LAKIVHAKEIEHTRMSLTVMAQGKSQRWAFSSDVMNVQVQEQFPSKHLKEYQHN
jgi:hypothetical protein